MHARKRSLNNNSNRHSIKCILRPIIYRACALIAAIPYVNSFSSRRNTVLSDPRTYFHFSPIFIRIYLESNFLLHKFLFFIVQIKNMSVMVHQLESLDKNNAFAIRREIVAVKICLKECQEHSSEENAYGPAGEHLLCPL